MSFLVGLVIGGAIGLIVGWNVLPQPAWVVRAYDKAVVWVKDKLGR